MRWYLMMLALVPLAACATGGADSRSSTTPAPAPPPVRVPERGQHVRVVFPAEPNQPERYIAGYLYRLAPDTVFMARGLRADTVLLTSGRRLETVTRTRHKGEIVGGLGFVAGAVVGGVVGAQAYEPCVPTGLFSCVYDPGPGPHAAWGALVGGAIGVIVGYAVGSAFRTEEWGAVPLAGGRVSVSPNGLGLRFAF